MTAKAASSKRSGALAVNRTSQLSEYEFFDFVASCERAFFRPHGRYLWFTFLEWLRRLKGSQQRRALAHVCYSQRNKEQLVYSSKWIFIYYLIIRFLFIICYLIFIEQTSILFLFLLMDLFIFVDVITRWKDFTRLTLELRVRVIKRWPVDNFSQKFRWFITIFFFFFFWISNIRTRDRTYLTRRFRRSV